MLSASERQFNAPEADGYYLIQKFYQAISYDASLPKPLSDQLEKIRSKYYKYLSKVFNTENFVAGIQEKILLIQINKLISEKFFHNKMNDDELQILINDINSNGAMLRNQLLSVDIREEILEDIRTINVNHPVDEIQSAIGSMSSLSLSSGNNPLNAELTRILNDGNDYLSHHDWHNAIQTYALGISRISNTESARQLYKDFRMEFIKLTAIAYQNQALSLIENDKEICLDSFFKVILTLTSIAPENLNVNKINVIKITLNEYMLHCAYFANKRQASHDHQHAIGILKIGISNINQIKKKFNFIDVVYLEKVLIDSYVSYQDYLQAKESFADSIPVLRTAIIENNKLIEKYNDSESNNLAHTLKYNLVAAITNAANRISIQGNVSKAIELLQEAMSEMKNYQITTHLNHFENNFSSICAQLSMIFNHNLITITEAELSNSIVALKSCIPALALLLRYKAVRVLIDVKELYAFKLKGRGDLKASHEILRSAEVDFIAIPAEFALSTDAMRLTMLHRHIAMSYIHEFSRNVNPHAYTVQTAQLAEQAYLYFKKIPLEFRTTQDTTKMLGSFNYKVCQMYMDAMGYCQRLNLKLAIDKFCLIIDYMNIALADGVETNDVRFQIYQGLQSALQTYSTHCLEEGKLNDLNKVCNRIKDSTDSFVLSNYHRTTAARNYLKSVISEQTNSFYNAITSMQEAIISMGQIQSIATAEEDLETRDFYLRNLIRLTLNEFQKNVPTIDNFNELQINYLGIAITSTYKIKKPTEADRLLLLTNVSLHNHLITEFKCALLTALNELFRTYSTQSLTFYNPRISIPFATLGLLKPLRNNLTTESLTKAKTAINSQLTQAACDPDSRFARLGAAVDKLLVLLKCAMVEVPLSTCTVSEATMVQYSSLRP